MRTNTVLLLTALVAVLVLNCSKFAVGGSQTAGILTDGQLTPLAIEADDDLIVSLRLQAKTALTELNARRTF